MVRPVVRASFFSGVGATLAGLAVPMLIPQAPLWVGGGILGVALIFFTVATTLYFGGRGGESSPGINMHHPTFNFYENLVQEAVEEQPEAPLNKFFPPTVTQSGGVLADDTLQATGVLFPLGLYVGMIIVSASRLAKENTLELAIRAFNGTGEKLRVAFVEGAIKAGRGNLNELLHLPPPVWRTEFTTQPIEPYAEFMVVLDQQLSPATTADYLEGVEQGAVSLDLRELNIVMEIADNPANRARLPLWHGVRIWRRDDIFTGRNTIMSAAGSARGTSTATGVSVQAD
jgi:hypothetical protein